MELWIIAGPNGSGKTTLVQKYIKRFAPQLPVVNPDDIAAKLNPSDPGLVAMRAGRNALKLQNQYLIQKKSFLLETTFSGKREIKLIETAKYHGYKVNLVFVGLPSPERNIKRVYRRVLDGGHNVPIEDIIRRYHRSMNNLALSIDQVDRAFIFDNKGKKYQLISLVKQGRLTQQSQILPAWYIHFTSYL